MKVEVAVLGSLTLLSTVVSVAVKQHSDKQCRIQMQGEREKDEAVGVSQ